MKASIGFWGLIMIIMDIALFPSLFAYSIWTDFTFFYLLILLQTLGSRTFLIALGIASLKAFFYFPELLWPYLGMIMLSLFLVFTFQKTILIGKYTWEMLSGISILSVQMMLISRFSFADILSSSLLHLIVWSFLFPLFYGHYQRKLKLEELRKGSAV
jgi:hypothetical protein